MKKRAFVVGVGLLLGAISVLGQHRASPQTLEGIERFAVIVEQLEENVRGLGLDRVELQERVIKKLRDSGVNVVADWQDLEEEGSPVLHIQINTQPYLRGELISYSVRLKFMQGVILSRNLDERILAPTWDFGGVGLAAREDFQFVGDNVIILLDSFVSDFTRANGISGADED